LRPALVDDALDRSAPVFFIDEAVELRVEPLETRYARLGEHAYAPRLLVTPWLQAAADAAHGEDDDGRGGLPGERQDRARAGGATCSASGISSARRRICAGCTRSRSRRGEGRAAFALGAAQGALRSALRAQA
jgi:hypothetical protein